MLRLAFDFIITWRETRTRPNAYLFSKKREDKDWETTDKEEDVLSNYIELDSLMQVIYHAKETESGS